MNVCELAIQIQNDSHSLALLTLHIDFPQQEYNFGS